MDDFDIWIEQHKKISSLLMEKANQTIIDEFDESSRNIMLDVADRLKRTSEEILVKAATYEKNREIKSLFALFDEIPSHTIIKAFLLSNQNPDDLKEMRDALISYISDAFEGEDKDELFTKCEHS